MRPTILLTPPRKGEMGELLENGEASAYFKLEITKELITLFQAKGSSHVLF